MFRTLLKDRTLIFLFFFALLIRLFSSNKAWVEQFYTYGIYPVLAKIMRAMFGWIPFSVGDVMYTCLALYLLYQLWKFLLAIKRKMLTKLFFFRIFKKILKLSLFFYVVFNVLWGLNYNRQGIARQLQLQDINTYSDEELFALTEVLSQRLNFYSAQVDEEKRNRFKKKKNLFAEGIAAFNVLQQQYPFLEYDYPSLKPSLYSHIGHYFGFTGYYNPFSGEAQIKTTVPVYLKPFIVTHEIAHQLGYAKENEANFVAFLACKNSNDIDFRYSVYFELFLYALAEVTQTGNAELTKNYLMNMHVRAKIDRIDFRNYIFRNQNYIEPWVSTFYDQFLRLNSQPKGKATYNEVIAWLIAYMKKYGVEAV